MISPHLLCLKYTINVYFKQSQVHLYTICFVAEDTSHVGAKTLGKYESDFQQKTKNKKCVH